MVFLIGTIRKFLRPNKRKELKHSLESEELDLNLKDKEKDLLFQSLWRAQEQQILKAKLNLIQHPKVHNIANIISKNQVLNDIRQGTLNNIIIPSNNQIQYIRRYNQQQQQIIENNIQSLKDWALLQSSQLPTFPLTKSFSFEFKKINGWQEDKQSSIRKSSSLLSLLTGSDIQLKYSKIDSTLQNRQYPLKDIEAPKVQLTDMAQNFYQQSKSALNNCSETAQVTVSNCSDNLKSLRKLILDGLNASEGIIPETKGKSLIVPFFPNPVVDNRELFDNFDKNFIQNLDLNTKPQGPFQIEALRRQKRKLYSKVSDLAEEGRNIAIYTTASLPWMTGTSVNPLLRAAFLAKETTRKVSLVVPWLAESDQVKVYPKGVTFDSPDKQEAYINNWIEKRTGFKGNFKVYFYPGKFAAEKQSILPVGDLTKYVPDHEADVAVLEEPEHLTWFHHGKRFTDKFNHVVGVIHTNYLDYARREEDGDLKATLLKRINTWTTRGQVHKIIKLSDAVQDFPRSETQYIHGVSPQFLEVGEKVSKQLSMGKEALSKGGYYIAKVLWSKGYRELVDILAFHKQTFGKPLNMDIYGMGNDFDAVKKECVEKQLNLNFHGMKDHADQTVHDYKVFINPCSTDVVATTTAEALAMGKFVVCANHPSNKFFQDYPNCLVYNDQKEFLEQVTYAFNNQPSPLSKAQKHDLTWEAATQRFLEVGSIGIKDKKPGLADSICALTHNLASGFDVLRIVAGAGSNTRQTPKRVQDYQPCEHDVGGLLDNKERARQNQVKQQQLKQQQQEEAAQQQNGSQSNNNN